MDDVISVGAPESTPAYPAPEKETPSDSQPDNNQPEQTPPSGEKLDVKEVPFHEHPRFKELIEEKNTLKRQLDDFTAKANPVLERLTPENKVEIPYWFNGDEKQWKDFEGYIGTLSDKKADEKITALKASQDAETKRVTDATQWFTDSVSEIEKEGSKVDRNKLLKFVLDNELIDGKGRWNYKAGYKFMAALEKTASDPSAQVELRKAIADQTRSDSKPEPKKSDVKSNEDFRRSKPW